MCIRDRINGEIPSGQLPILLITEGAVVAATPNALGWDNDFGYIELQNGSTLVADGIIELGGLSTPGNDGRWIKLGPGGGTISVPNGQSVNMRGRIFGGEQLTKEGAGELTLFYDNTSGSLPNDITALVQEGTLIIQDEFPGSPSNFYYPDQADIIGSCIIDAGDFLVCSPLGSGGGGGSNGGGGGTTTTTDPVVIETTSVEPTTTDPAAVETTTVATTTTEPTLEEELFATAEGELVEATVVATSVDPLDTTPVLSPTSTSGETQELVGACLLYTSPSPRD